MFEAAELPHHVDRELWETESARVRQALLDAQVQLGAKAGFPVVVVIAGVDGAGKGETVHVLHEWMDPRHLRTHAYGEPTDEERQRPAMWRYWRDLPPKGRIGLFFGSWYTAPILARARGEMGGGRFERELEAILRLERMLADEGTLLLKFWFHLSKDQQKQRLRRLRDDPETRWRVTKQELRNFKRYDDFRRTSERALRQTSTAWAPWHVVPGADARYRSLTVGRVLLDALQARLQSPDPVATVPPVPLAAPPLDHRTLVSSLQPPTTPGGESYEEALTSLQRRLALAVRSKRFTDRSLVVVFEGMDASGKGGAIRRVASALDPRTYDIHPIAAPSDEDRAHPYLWRFWRRLPRHGKVAIFDRSWYGRVLVERVEGFCSEADWRRAYAEINDFEEQLAGSGAILVKVWLQVSQEEQLKRFREREETPWKRFKITAEDWRNRDKWPDYEQAVADLVDRTSTDGAPWSLVQADDKKATRIAVLQAIVDRLEAEL